MHQDNQSFLPGMEEPICFVCSQSDTIYYHQAMKVADSNKFRKAMIKGIATHFERQHWELKDIKQILPMTKLLDSV